MHNFLIGGSVFFFNSDDIFFQNIVVITTVVIIAITCLSLLRRREHLKAAAPPATADAAIVKRRNDEVILRAAKLEFLERVGNRYGYRNSEKGYIDDWREREFPSLISPIQIITTPENTAASGGDNRRRSSPAQKETATAATATATIPTERDDFLEQEVYLDYAGSALPTRSQLSQCLSTQQTQYQILANPHSMGGGHASDRTISLIQRVKDEVRNHFGIDNDRLYLGENNNEEEERERRTKEGDEYQFIFTSGATESLKLVAERFPWTSLKFTTSTTAATEQQYSQILMKCDAIPSTNDGSIQYNNLQSIHFRSILLYPKNVHTSVIGMRNISLQHEAIFHCVTVEELLLEATSSSWFQRLVVDDATIISYNDSMEEALKNHDSDANYCRNEEKKDDHVVQEQCCDGDMTSVTCKTIWVHHLLVLPQECNFSGDRFDWSNIIAAARDSTFCTYLNCSTATTTTGGQHQLLRVCHKWNILLDVAKAAATSPVDIPNMFSPDYAVASFYKMFGYPTGLGILIMKKEPNRVRRIMGDTSEEESMMINSSEAPSIQEENHSPRRRHYFGGGSVDVILPHKDFVITRNSQQLVGDNDGEHVNLGVMVHGTEHFRGILQLTHGFKELTSLGGMKAICSHATCLAEELVCRLKKLVHDNGASVVQIYGRWGDIAGKHTAGKGVLLPGPTVTFNIQDRDGSIIGYDEVSRLSSLNNPPIQLRTGCFCNPGACQEALALSEVDVLEHYQSGHVCGDRKGVLNGKPTGAIRASFGKDSVWEDMNALVSFIQKVFVSRGGALSLPSARTDNARNENTAVIVDSLFVFPIKSCAAMKVNRWPIHRQTGRFLFDREFALVDSSGSAMRLHSYPQMSQIHSSIDLDTNILIVSAPHRDDLVLSLDVSEGDETITPEDVQVCGVLCKGTIWGGRKASSWFSSILGVRCWLARHHVDKKKTSRSGNKRNDGLAYSNEASLLLVSQNSISMLNSVISSQGWGKQVVARHFRPNIVVSSSSEAQEDETDFLVIGNPEDFWQKICIKSEDNKELELIAVGKCARCQMVDVDPDSGMKGKTLRALAEYRRERGKIMFGTFFTANTNESSEVFWVEEGAEVTASSS
jgi:molybdenum cofactor sulfurtransferase